MLTLKNIPKNKPWIDYSSLSMLMRCPRQYYWRCIREVTTSGEKSALINGQAYHEGKAIYLKSKLKGLPHEKCVELALKSMIPIMSEIKIEDKKRNITVAIGTMSNYLDYWKDEVYKTLDVEIKFAIDLINFLFVGRIDAYKEHPTFGKLVEETKTTSIIGRRWEMRGKPNLQIDGYVAAIYVNTGDMPAGGILDIIPVTEKMNEKPLRFITPRSLSDVEDWMSNIQEWWITLSRYKDSGIYPQNTETCVPLVGFTCDYTTLCSLYPHPYRMESIDLPAEYKQDFWMPFPELGGMK